MTSERNTQMGTEGTVGRLYARYNTYSRRPTVRDSRVRAVVFRAFERTVGPWLPADRATPILDVGCGEGALLAFLRARGYANLAGFDLSPENVAICHALGLDFVEQGDALCQAERYPPGSFGVIFVMDVLKHLPKQRAADFLEQVRQCLRPGGAVIIQTPNMGSVFGVYHRYDDLSHEFGLTEKTARDLLMVAGFRNEDIEIRPAWNATTPLGYARELYLRLLHNLVFLAEGGSRPRIPTTNLLIRARVP